MNKLTNLIKDFHSHRHADDDVRGLREAIMAFPTVSVVEEYALFYNKNLPEGSNDWHFWWIFSSLPLNWQLNLLEDAVGTPVEARTVFQKRLLQDNRIFDLLRIGQDSPHATLFKMLGFGWSYYIRNNQPNQSGIDSTLAKLIPSIRLLL